jgi:hypothetical protein
MGAQIDQITSSFGSSLTHVIEDMQRQPLDGATQPVARTDELQDWLNALQRQATPLIFSKSGRANLEAWLESIG